MANQKCKVSTFNIYDGVDQDGEGNVTGFVYNIQATIKTKNKREFDIRKLWDKIEEIINSNEVKE